MSNGELYGRGMQISPHWRLKEQRYRLEGVRFKNGETSLQNRLDTSSTLESRNKTAFELFMNGSLRLSQDFLDSVMVTVQIDRGILTRLMKKLFKLFMNNHTYTNFELQDVSIKDFESKLSTDPGFLEALPSTHDRESILSLVLAELMSRGYIDCNDGRYIPFTDKLLLDKQGIFEEYITEEVEL